MGLLDLSPREYFIFYLRRGRGQWGDQPCTGHLHPGTRGGHLIPKSKETQICLPTNHLPSNKSEMIKITFLKQNELFPTY